MAQQQQSVNPPQAKSLWLTALMPTQPRILASGTLTSQFAVGLKQEALGL